MIVSDNNGMVVSFISVGLQAAEHLSLEEVIAAYGDPSSIVIADCSHGTRCEVRIDYMAKGIELTTGAPRLLFRPQYYAVHLSPDLLIDSILMFPLGGYTTTVGAAFIAYQIYPIPWTGYNDYSDSR